MADRFPDKLINLDHITIKVWDKSFSPKELKIKDSMSKLNGLPMFFLLDKLKEKYNILSYQKVHNDEKYVINLSKKGGNITGEVIDLKDTN